MKKDITVLFAVALAILMFAGCEASGSGGSGGGGGGSDDDSGDNDGGLPTADTDPPPELLGATLDAAATTLNLNFSEAVSNVSAANWAVKLNGDTAVTVSSVSGGGADWTFSLSPAINYWDDITLSYTGDAVTDSGGNKLYPVGGMGVLNVLEDPRDAGLYADSNRTIKLGSAPLTIADAIDYIKNSDPASTAYTLLLDSDQDCDPQTLSISTLKSGVSLRLKGKGSERTIQLSETGSLFSVESGITLILDKHITLKGIDKNNQYYALVKVSQGGTLKMLAGSNITGNSNSYSIYSGGGVCVYGGTFEMSGGAISGNTSSSSYGGGGVYVSSGTFEMSGGAINGNTAHSSGGGVYVSGTFTKTSAGGVIYGKDGGDNRNTAGAGDTEGHAVYYRPTANKQYYRDTSVGASDSLSTNQIPISGTGNGWTKK
jgi:hypothetical protein